MPTTNVEPPVRAHHVAVTPHWGHAFSPSESHDSMGLGVEYLILHRLALGIDASIFGPFNRDFERVGATWPRNETLWSASVDVKVIALRARTETWSPEVYFLGGVGAISTRPISAVDPAHRVFSFQARIAYDVGVGLRLGLTPWLSAVVEIRDTMYNEALERRDVAAAAPGDRGTWYGDARLTNVVEPRLALTFLL